MKANLILLSHGNMAEETLKSAEMIVGKIENAYTIQMLHDDGMEGVKNKLNTILDKLKNNTILIIADLYGGTPFNVAMMLCGKNENIKIVSGLNLGMVIEYATSDEENINTLANYLCSEGREAIQVAEFEESDDDIDA